MEGNNENENKGISTEEEVEQNHCLWEVLLLSKLIPWINWIPYFFPRNICQSHSSDCGWPWKTYAWMWQGPCYWVLCLFEYHCKCVLKCTCLFLGNWIFWNKSTVRNNVESFKCYTHIHTHTHLCEYRHHSESKKKITAVHFFLNIYISEQYLY